MRNRAREAQRMAAVRAEIAESNRLAAERETLYECDGCGDKVPRDEVQASASPELDDDWFCTQCIKAGVDQVRATETGQYGW